ncbi:MAG: hypothetical protein JSS75_08885 [Bacteroidetes bacterium]|nr:hypothetical protein [Bacteroidota bacterium]
MTHFEAPRFRTVSLLCFLAIFVVAISGSRAQTLPFPSTGQNMDFEDDSLMHFPLRGWFTPAKEYMPNYAATISKTSPSHGVQCARIASVAPPNPGEFGNLMQTIDAKPYRGKVVRFRAALRTDGSTTCYARLWMRVDRSKQRTGFSDNMSDRRVNSSTWRSYDIIGRVDTDAVVINIGCMLNGSGEAYIDDAHFDIVEADSMLFARQEAKPLTPRGLENLVAFAKLYGYVRFFHPSDGVADANWNIIPINGVRAVEDAPDAATLATRLQTFFAPVAPLLRVFANEKPAATPPELAHPSDTDVAIAWLHHGVRLLGDGNMYNSRRVSADEFTGRTATEGAYGGLTQTVNASSLRGQHVTYSVYTHSGFGSHEVPVEFAIRVASHGAFNETPLEHTLVVPSPQWQRVSVSATIPVDADSISVSARIYAATGVYYDDEALCIGDSVTPEHPNLLLNGSFEEGWKHWDGSPTNDYVEDIRTGEHFSGMAAAFSTVSQAVKHTSAFPSTTPARYDLGAGVSCLLPIALPKSLTHLLGTGGHRAIDTLRSGYYPSGNDRATRLADVITAWNIIEHFWPYFDVVHVDWMHELRAALTRAASDDDDLRFGRTLRIMMASLHDGHAWVGDMAPHRQAPFTAVIADSRVVVNQLAEGYAGAIRVGDVINKVNGVPIAQWYARIDSLTPAATRTAHEYKVYENLYAALDADSVVLTISDRDNKYRDIAEVVPSVTPTFARPKKEHIGELRDGIWYVDLDATTSDELSAALGKLEHANAVIFDLRGYPNHMLREPISHMISTTALSPRMSVPLVMLPDRVDAKWSNVRWQIKPSLPHLTNIVHLADGRAVSAAETYLSIIDAYHIGEIVGDTTAGTDGNINPFTLPGEFYVSWTGMQVLKHDGSQLHDVGIAPTVVCKPTLRGIRDGKDEVLEKGIEVAEKMIAHQPIH